MLKLKLQYFGDLMWRVDSLEKTLMLGKIEGRRRRGRQRMKCLNGITDSMGMSLSRLWETVKAREAWHAAIHQNTNSRARLTKWTTTTSCLAFRISRNRRGFILNPQKGWGCYPRSVVITRQEVRCASLEVKVDHRADWGLDVDSISATLCSFWTPCVGHYYDSLSQKKTVIPNMALEMIFGSS